MQIRGEELGIGDFREIPTHPLNDETDHQMGRCCGPMMVWRCRINALAGSALVKISAAFSVVSMDMAVMTLARELANEALSNAVVLGHGVVDSLTRLDKHTVIVRVARGGAAVTVPKLVQ